VPNNFHLYYTPKDAFIPAGNAVSGRDPVGWVQDCTRPWMAASKRSKDGLERVLNPPNRSPALQKTFSRSR